MQIAILRDISQHRPTMDAELSDSYVSTGKAKPMPMPDNRTQASLKTGSDSEESHSKEASNHAPSGLILKSGRVRLPDRLMEYLNKEVAPEALYWMPEGESFAFDTAKAPDQFLSKYFSGTKMTSFLRSISRWGFKRVFYHDLEKHVYAFHHPLFKKASPHLEKEMKMIVSAPSQSKKAKAKKNTKPSEDAGVKSVTAMLHPSDDGFNATPAPVAVPSEHFSTLTASAFGTAPSITLPRGPSPSVMASAAGPGLSQPSLGTESTLGPQRLDLSAQLASATSGGQSGEIEAQLRLASAIGSNQPREIDAQLLARSYLALQSAQQGPPNDTSTRTASSTLQLMQLALAQQQLQQRREQEEQRRQVLLELIKQQLRNNQG